MQFAGRCRRTHAGPGVGRFNAACGCELPVHVRLCVCGNERHNPWGHNEKGGGAGSTHDPTNDPLAGRCCAGPVERYTRAGGAGRCRQERLERRTVRG